MFRNFFTYLFQKQKKLGIIQRQLQLIKIIKKEQLALKIDGPNKTITRIYTYTISYRLSETLTCFSDYDEIYWNILANQWRLPIDKVKAQIFLPSPFLYLISPNP